jgi:hypothetical protein
MIMYNVTVNVDAESAEDWLDWMRSVHIPEVLATGLFAEAKIARILAEEEGGKAFSVQYYAPSMEDFETYEKTHATRLRAKHQEKFGNKTVAFRTLLHVIHHDDGQG